MIIMSCDSKPLRYVIRKHSYIKNAAFIQRGVIRETFNIISYTAMRHIHFNELSETFS